MISRSASIDHGATARDRASVVLSAVLALAFGVFLVYGAGFANSAAIHDAAHDVRHANALPCH